MALIIKSCGHLLLQAGTYVISSPYIRRFDIRGSEKIKNHFFFLLAFVISRAKNFFFFFFLHLGPKKSIFGQKFTFSKVGIFYLFT